VQLSGAVQRGVAGQSRALALLAHGVVSHRAYWPRVHIQQCPQEMLNGMTARSPGLMWLTTVPGLAREAPRKMPSPTRLRRKRAQGYPSEPTSFRQGVSRQGRLARGRSKLGG